MSRGWVLGLVAVALVIGMVACAYIAVGGLITAATSLVSVGTLSEGNCNRSALDSRLFGHWVSDTTDTVAVQSAGLYDIVFRDDCTATFTSVTRNVTIPTSWATTSDGFLRVNQAPDPFSSRNPYSFQDGKLKIQFITLVKAP